MMTLRNTMDQFFENSFRSMGDWQATNQAIVLSLEVGETPEAFVVTAVVPGIEPGALDITLSNNRLTIAGEFTPHQRDNNVRYHLSEYPYGKFSRTLTLPMAVQAEQIAAHYHNGLVSITLPKAESAKPKRIQVQSNGHQTIEGQTA
jgi:HSP20 family protein